ncbi:MAG TPA: protein kinase [Gemmataceae bacterium]|jgi:uncharacterized protein (TIGR03067 family)|nr:protein kinase [Gemmataceae bacterium]
MTERDIFLAVLDLPDPVARTAYIQSACGDDAARRARVEALLRAHDAAGSFLAEPAVAAVPGNTQAFDATADAGAESTAETLSFLSPSQRPDSLGRIGHYEVLEVLGRGGFGIVLRSFDDVLQRVVALKVLAPEMAATSPARKRFLREARSSAQVRHENVVQVYAVEEQPLPYLVMEFIPGETLQQRLDRTGPLDVPEVLRISRQVTEGLAAAHAQGLIHRDIKPANVMIEGGARQRVKLTDFGLARAADDASISQSGIVAGTPLYMAPEQAKGETLDHRADLFSLGSVMYAMLTGHPPFRAATTLAVLKRVTEDQPRPIREVIPEVPDWLCRIVEKLHAKDPAERFQTAREVADVLADCETQWKAHGVLKDFSRIPGGRLSRPGRAVWRRRLVTAVAIFVPIAAGVFVVARRQRDAAMLEFIKSRETIPLNVKQVQPAAPGWVEVFNGKNLDGWHEVGSKGTWVADNGILRAIARAGYLFSDRSYTDFHLKAEVRISPGTDFGILFHTDRVAADATRSPVNGHAVEFTYGGPIGDVEGRVNMTMRFTGEMPGATTGHNLRPHEWLPFDMVVKDDGVKVDIAGGMIGGGFPKPHKASPVILRLAKNDSVVELRNIRIQDLSAAVISESSQVVAGVAGNWESDWGPVTLEHGSIKVDHSVTVTGSYLVEGDKRGVITQGTFDPVQRTLHFTFAESWWNGTGSADLRLSADGNKLEGTWRNSNSESGVWTMIRRPAGASLPAARKSDQEIIQGTWRGVSASTQGRRVPELILKAVGPAITFADNKVTWKANPSAEVKDFFGGLLANFRLEGIFHLDPTKSPKTIDLTVLGQNAKTPIGTAAPRVLLGIYRLEGDSLELCITVDPEHAEERPGKFETVPGKLIGHIKLRRQFTAQAAPAVIEGLRNLVAAKERTFETTDARFAAGQVSAFEKTLAQIELTEARARLAEAEGDRATMLARLKELVAFREEERRFVSILVEVGRAAHGELDQADARVAEAKTRLAQAQSAAPGSAAPAAKPPGDVPRRP